MDYKFLDKVLDQLVRETTIDIRMKEEYIPPRPLTHILPSFLPLSSYLLFSSFSDTL